MATLDVTDAAKLDEFCAQLPPEFKEVDILINNAGEGRINVESWAITIFLGQSFDRAFANVSSLCADAARRPSAGFCRAGTWDCARA